MENDKNFPHELQKKSSTEIQTHSETAALVQRAHETQEEAAAKNTRRSYTTAANAFIEFADRNGIQFDSINRASPTEAANALGAILAVFAQDLYDKGRKLSTIESRVYAVVSMLRDSADTMQLRARVGIETPHHATTEAPQKAMQGLRRRTAQELRDGNYDRQLSRVKAVTNAELYSALRHIDTTTMQGLRDKCLLLFGRLGALRRSEIVALNIEDVEEFSGAIVLHLHGTKTSKGKTVDVVLGADTVREECPVVAFRDYKEALRRRGIRTGALFVRIRRGGHPTTNRLTGNTVRDTVIFRLKKAAFNTEGFSAHSLRAGFATEAARQGITLPEMMEHGRWTEPKTVLSYVRPSDTRSATLTNRMRRR